MKMEADNKNNNNFDRNKNGCFFIKFFKRNKKDLKFLYDFFRVLKTQNIFIILIFLLKKSKQKKTGVTQISIVFFLFFASFFW
jgi:chromate transport protein ChrA